MAQVRETTYVPSDAFTAMRQFCTSNSKATTLLHTAAVDYSSTRCLLLNGLVSVGLAVGAQAIEKFLKAYILLKNPVAAVRKLQHSLLDLLNEADQLSPGLGLSKYSPLMDRFWRHYQHRYPDNANASTSMTSEEIFELDGSLCF